MTTFRASARTLALPKSLFGDLDRGVAAARAAGIDVIDVSKGNPDTPTPAHIVRVMQESVADPRNHGYTGSAPRVSFTQAVAKRYREDHGVEIDPHTQVAAFHGSHEGLISAVLSLTDPGETIVAPDPGYPAYVSAARLAGAEMRLVPLPRDRGYQPEFSAIADLDSASVLLLNFPHNPTGAVATADTYRAAVAESERLGAAYINDFAYSSLGFAAPPLSALSIDQSRTVEISTLSKTYNMAGWRIGFAAGSAELIAIMRRYQIHAFSTIFGSVQDAAAAALDGDQSAAHELVQLYRARRDLVVTGLRAQGWDVTDAEGAFFVWMGVDGADDREFAERLLQNYGIAVAPGSGFGDGGAGYVRISLVLPEDRLSEMIERFARARHSLSLPSHQN